MLRSGDLLRQLEHEGLLAFLAAVAFTAFVALMVRGLVRVAVLRSIGQRGTKWRHWPSWRLHRSKWLRSSMQRSTSGAKEAFMTGEDAGVRSGSPMPSDADPWDRLHMWLLSATLQQGSVRSVEVKGE